MKLQHKLLIGALLLVAVIAGYNLAYILHPPESKPLIVEASEPPVNLIGAYRPDFTLPDLTGTPRDIAEWGGKVLLINFWATWCAPCREEIPALMAVRHQFKASGFEIVGIAIDQAEFVTEYARDLGITYPLLYGEEEAVEVGRLYGNRQGTLPYSVFIDAKGRIAQAHSSGILTESELASTVKSLLNGTAENEPKRSKLP